MALIAVPMGQAGQQDQRSVVIITVHVRTVDIMTVRSLTSVSGVVGVEIINGVLKDLMESVSQKMRRSVVITFPVRTVDIMTVRSLTSVSGVVGVEIINGVLKDLMESVSPEREVLVAASGLVTVNLTNHASIYMMLAVFVSLVSVWSNQFLSWVLEHSVDSIQTVTAGTLLSFVSASMGPVRRQGGNVMRRETVPG